MSLRACTSKEQYETEEAARGAARRMGKNVRPYLCPNGNHWHVGHARGEFRKHKPGRLRPTDQDWEAIRG